MTIVGPACTLSRDPALPASPPSTAGLFCAETMLGDGMGDGAGASGVSDGSALHEHTIAIRATHAAICCKAISEISLIDRLVDRQIDRMPQPGTRPNWNNSI